MTEVATAEALVLDDSLHDLYENAACGLLSTTAAGEIIRANRTLLTWLGHRDDELVGQPFDRLLGPGSYLFFQTRCLPVLTTKADLREVALDLHGPAGTLSVLVNFVVRPEVDSAVRVIRVAVFDVTHRQAYRRDLLSAGRAAERSELRVRVLREASTTFGAAGSTEELSKLLADAARSAFDTSSTAVLLLSDDGAELRLRAGRHPSGEVISMAACGPEARAIRCGVVVTIRDVEEAEATFPDLALQLQDNRFAAMTVIPLRYEDVVLGVLVCHFGRIRPFDEDELQLGRELAQLAGVALQHIRLEKQLHHRALHDQLTGLANRELLHRELTGALSDADRRGRPMALLFIDLDGFKQVNDQYGHLVGDLVLVATAQRLRDAVRHGDIVARIGGDEFLVVCANVDSDVAMLVADRIRRAVRQPIEGGFSSYCVSSSIGVAVHRPGDRAACTANALIAAADAAMYQSKAHGKDHATLVDLSPG